MKTWISTISIVLMFSAGIQAQNQNAFNSEGGEEQDTTNLAPPEDTATIGDIQNEITDETTTDNSTTNSVVETERFRRPIPGRFPHRPWRPIAPGRHPRHPPGDRFPPPYFPPGNPYNPGYSDYVDCSSWNYAYSECYVNGYVRNAGVYQRNSNSSCVYGYSWGIIGNRIWVDKGCRAVFWVEY